jgi:DNA-binding NtrC family response regulator
MNSHSILLIDDDELILESLETYFSPLGYEVDVCMSGEKALALLNAEEKHYSVIVVDYELGATNLNGPEIIKAIKSKIPDQLIVCLSGMGDDPDVVKSTWRAGAIDFVDKADLQELEYVIANACEKYDEFYRPLEVSEAKPKLKLIKEMGLCGESPQALKIAKQIDLYRSSKRNILILGETGTGKKIIAEALHTGEKNRFFTVNCADYSDQHELLRSELFGYTKGSFTGANRDKPGIFEQAKGGTVFLDEVHELSPAAQAQLYLAVEEHKIKRVGGSQYIPIDVKIIAAAKPHLEKMANEGGFRPDLFERLNVLCINVAPLRERKEDIPHFVQLFCEEFEKDANEKKYFLEKTVNLLQNYSWPRNVRELRNTVLRTLFHASSQAISPKDLDSRFYRLKPSGGLNGALQDYKSFKDDIDQQTARYFNRVYKQHEYNAAKTAQAIGIAPNTLRSILKRHGLDSLHKN